jgi:hypothetical protein
MQEAVTRVRLPVRRLATTGHHHARPERRAPQRRFHRSAQVHVHRHRTNYSSSVMHQQHQLAQRRLPAQVQYPLQRRMMMR